MKKLRIVLLSAAVIMIGVGAAFATRADDIPGNTEYLNPQTELCEPLSEECSVSGSKLCTWTEGATIHTLYRRGTKCTVQMFRPSN